jgi:hypothetical protein
LQFLDSHYRFLSADFTDCTDGTGFKESRNRGIEEHLNPGILESSFLSSSRRNRIGAASEHGLSGIGVILLPNRGKSSRRELPESEVETPRTPSTVNKE